LAIQEVGWCNWGIDGVRVLEAVGRETLLLKRIYVVDPSVDIAPSRSDHYYDGQPKADSLGRSGKGDNPGCDFDTVFRRRLGILFLFGLGGFLLSIWAGSNLDDDRRLLRPTLIGVGFLSLLGSLGLFALSQYRDTWCWLL
jgi:hypothetical protein